ncbi:mitochondrial carrier [Aspergillus ruber CBS 135680]|uniref:Mitochondrial carrier n=1 Tax=Aspergillus ruber (strain CBS 135680) TaxID=1388766 RepID=A0A017SAJ4_ASPRC|nr:mitochondrial carrier [Aspergillus ruber CBS 135680]EYE93962.1 mitochondrial carrier [Aspergillus ruber CBS 135680]
MQESARIQGRQFDESVSVNTAHVLEKKKAPGPWVHLLAGASGGLATAIVTSPLDVLRTRLQSDIYRVSDRPFAASFPTPKTNTANIISSIYRIEGWPAFFRGLGPSLAGVVPATAIKFYVYGNCKQIGANLLNHGQDSPFVHAQAAICAGIATATATNPIWLVKTRLQLDRAQTHAGEAPARRYRNSVDCVRQVIRHEGIRGLYRGMSASYLGTVETALHLVLYEKLKTVFNQSLKTTEGASPTWTELAHWASTSGAAGSAKLAANLLTYPHEVVRTRLRQAPKENGIPKYTGLVQCFRTVLKEEGMAGMYGGLVPHTARSVPSAVITLGVYEFVLRLVGV